MNTFIISTILSACFVYGSVICLTVYIWSECRKDGGQK